MNINRTCIICPIGCNLTITDDGGDIRVSGNICKRGERYGIQEMASPTRIVTDIIATTRGYTSCKTSAPIPKDKIIEVLGIIGRSYVDKDVDIGDVLIENVMGLGVDIIATSNNKN